MLNEKGVFRSVSIITAFYRRHTKLLVVMLKIISIDVAGNCKMFLLLGAAEYSVNICSYLYGLFV